MPRRRDFRSRWIFLLVLVDLSTIVQSDPVVPVRPEIVLLDVLARPFPDDAASTSGECRRDVEIYRRELADYAPWALLMYDASAKMSPGVITGNYQQLGNYDECLRIRAEAGFAGRACSASVQFDVAKPDDARRPPDIGDLLLGVAVASNATEWDHGRTIQYEWLWCIPSSCTAADLQSALETALEPLRVKDRVDLTVQVRRDSCRTADADRRSLDRADFVYISVLAAFALILAVGTTYDLTRRGKVPIFDTGRRHALLTSFSLYANGRQLLRTSRRADAIGCLDGIRFLSICWIIYGHTLYNEIVGLNVELSTVVAMHDDWSSMLVLNGNIVTDTFFLLSGTLLAYVTMSKRDKFSDNRLNLLNLYVHRYLRLTPAYAMMIGFYATIFYKLGTGPHWDAWVGTNRDYCRENWWTNLLYVNNYINVPRMCMSHSWYLATDMQLIWLSPIFLYPMLKCGRARVFWIVLGVGLALSILAPSLVTYLDHLTGTMIYYKDQTDVANVYLQIYTRVYNRAGPYIIGLGLGYILSRTRSSNFKIPMTYVMIGWTVATVAGFSVIFGPITMYKYAYNRTAATFYAGLHRHVFAFFVSWIIFTSTHGYAGPIGTFLSWSGWMPLSKLTYSAYLCHFLFLLADTGSARTPHYLTPMNTVRTFFGNLVLTMMLSAVWSLCFEMPFLTLERALPTRRKPAARFPAGAQDVFRSTPADGNIGRSMDTVTTSQNLSDVTLSRDSVYASQGTISCSIGEETGFESEREVEVAPRFGSKDGQEAANYVYVVEVPDYARDNATYASKQPKPS